MQNKYGPVSENPKLISEWDHEKNKHYDPTVITCGSGKRVWWKCKNNHSWNTKIAGRQNGMIGCPYCAGKRVISGKNDLFTVRKDLLSEWDYKKNADVSMEEISINSEKKYWWKCKDGHSWKASPLSRKIGGCPYCAGKIPVSGVNDLLTLRPDIIIHWDYDKNKLTPDKVSLGSDRYVWWICDKGHSFSRIVYSYVKSNSCPYCTGKKVLKGFNDLLTVLPDVAEQWDYSKNGDLLPDAVSVGSNRKVWWICKYNHSWKTSVNNRRHGKSGCPYCAGVRVITGVNDLQSQRPEIASSWCYEVNDKKPNEVTVYSNKKFWWECIYGHRWEATVANRSYGYGCPYCSGLYAVAGQNDIFTVYPELIKIWNFDKNTNYDPKTITVHSEKKVWWLCEKGHEWKTKVSLVTAGYGCPYCSGKKAIRGVNDLQTLYPELAKEWAYDKNGDLKPDMIKIFSNKAVWWRCKNGHEWLAIVESRVNGNDCPYCKGKRQIKTHFI